MDEQTEAEPRRGINVTMVLFGVLLLVLLGGGAYYYISQQKNVVPPQEENGAKPTVTSIPPTPTLTPIQSVASPSAALPEMKESTNSATP